MSNVVFVAPFFLPATLRFIAAAASLAGVRLGLISQDPLDRLPAAIRERLAAHYQIRDGLDPDQIELASHAIAGETGRVDRLLATLEELQIPAAEVRERLGIDGLSVEAAGNFRDKKRMKEVLTKAGLPCARHGLVASAEAAREFACDVGFPLVVKPPAGAGARDTFRIDDSDRLEQYLGTVPPSPDRPALIEEFLTGQERSFDSVCVDGRLVWHSINRYLPSPLEVLREPWIQWCVLLPREMDDPADHKIRAVAEPAIRALGLETGMSHMEWFRREDGAAVISEVGARPPGAEFTTLISFAHDTDFYARWAELMVFGRFDPPVRSYAAGAAFLRGQGSGRVKAIHGLDQAQKELGALVVEAKLPSLGQAQRGGYEGDGHVILRDPSTRVVEEGLNRLVSIIQVELG